MNESRIELQVGARATEAALLAEVGHLVAAAREQPELLRDPVRIIVPSRSLREHVSARLVETHGALVGVLVQTLRGVACEVLRRAGRPTPGGDLWVPVLVRRCAAADPTLRAALDELHDGYGVVAATVGDLLDAGLEEAHVEGVEEFLAEAVGGVLARRGRGLVRVAQSVAQALAAHGLEHRSDVLRAAAEQLGRDPSGLPTRALLVHGIADVTGRGAELLVALTRADARVFVDRPPDPGDPLRPSAGVAFVDRLLERLDLPQAADQSAHAAPELHAFRAPGAEAEVREVGERCAVLIDAGVRPETIGVVARDLTEYVAPLRVQFQRLGVAFSGAPGTCPVAGPARHPGAAVLELLRDGSSLPADRWLDASEGLAALRERDLRLALHALGLARLGDVASLDVAAVVGAGGEYRLPVRRGVRREEPEEGGEGTGTLRAVSRRLPARVLESAQRRAARVAQHLERWPRDASLAHHLRELDELLRALEWEGGRPGTREWRGCALGLAEALDSELELTREELVVLLERATREVGMLPLGGSGGGVAVLSVVEARARTFEHLFVMGLNRDRFPRPIVDDPLLPDGLRLRLAEMLPDVPVKSRGFDEERYLFGQLCSAAPQVTLSWQEVSDDGKERAPSPLVQRLLLTVPELASKAALVGDVLAERPGALVPEWERGVRLGLRGDRGGLRPERARVVAELDAPFESEPHLGPYFGWTGSLGGDADLYVTRLEAMARCGWQEFLERVLGIEPLPDARIALPGLDARVVGSVVHDVLERIVTDAGVPAREALDPAAPGHDVPWPDEKPLAELLLGAASQGLRAEGIQWPGFAVVLAQRAREFVDRARENDWPNGILRDVVGAELRGSARLDSRAEGEGDRELRVWFRADRVDRSGDALVLTDYKTGQPQFLAVKKQATREAKLLGEIEEGTALQGAAYARADLGETTAHGRYLSLKEGVDPPRDIQVAGEEALFAKGFERTVGVLLAQRAAGSFLPRLVGKSGEIPQRCKEWCEVRDACLQHDTRSRHRLRAWAEASSSDGPAEEAARRGWSLGDGKDR
ncbi:MAG: PD-(D/E)XK nuclease family protein [Myxococcales bacterium]|nr:PD-(D/E)XK nuclease family protein [Myxococcales bacterium]